MNSKYLLAPVLGALGFCFAVPTLGQERTERVEIGDLNLDTERGLELLDRRIRNAVRVVCGVRTARKEDIQLMMANRQCLGETMAKAIESRDALLALLQNEGRQEVATIAITLSSDS